MKVLSLTQPWATLVAIGVKKIETRSWATKYRGKLAIHASAGLGMGQKEFNWFCLAGNPAISFALSRAFYAEFCAGKKPSEFLPRGEIIAVTVLTGCFNITELNAPPEPEYSFGDYAPGRWGWNLDRAHEIPPIKTKGSLGLWEHEIEGEK